MVTTPRQCSALSPGRGGNTRRQHHTLPGAEGARGPRRGARPEAGAGGSTASPRRVTRTVLVVVRRGEARRNKRKANGKIEKN